MVNWSVLDEATIGLFTLPFVIFEEKKLHTKAFEFGLRLKFVFLKSPTNSDLSCKINRKF